MNRTRIMLAAYVDLDPMPGTFHTADSARNAVSGMLKDRIGHYSPVVSVVSYGRQLYNVEFNHHNRNWASNSEFNILFIKNQMNYANDTLTARGYLFLNDLYGMLGVPLTREGQLVGWTEGPISWDPKYLDDGRVDISFYAEGCIIDKAFDDDHIYETPVKRAE